MTTNDVTRSPLVRSLRRRGRQLIVTGILISIVLFLIQVSTIPQSSSIGDPPSPGSRDVVNTAELRRRLLQSVDDSTFSSEVVRRQCAIWRENENGSNNNTNNNNKNNINNSSNSSCESPPLSMLRDVIASRPSVFSRSGVDCQALFRGDVGELENAAEKSGTQTSWSSRIWRRKSPSTANDSPADIDDEDDGDDAGFVNSTRDCRAYRRTRGYITSPLSRDEAEFPIAFSIVMYDNVAQAGILLIFGQITRP